jgi:MFS family permease
MHQEEQSMKMEYFVVALANLAMGALLFFAPISQDAPAWSKWTLAAICAVCGWLLWQRGAEEQSIWPLKLVCYMTLIFGLFPLLYIPSVESFLEVLNMNSPKVESTPEDVWNLQRQFALLGIQVFCVYLMWFAFHALKKGRKTWLPMFFGVLGFVLLYLHGVYLVGSIGCLFIAIGFFRLYQVERYEHF